MHSLYFTQTTNGTRLVIYNQTDGYTIRVECLRDVVPFYSNSLDAAWMCEDVRMAVNLKVQDIQPALTALDEWKWFTNTEDLLPNARLALRSYLEGFYGIISQ